jgi:hypothetical protein
LYIVTSGDKIYSKGFEICDGTVLHTALFADDQVLLSDPENNLQRASYTLHNAIKQFGMKISPLILQGQVQIRRKL